MPASLSAALAARKENEAGLSVAAFLSQFTPGQLVALKDMLGINLSPEEIEGLRSDHDAKGTPRLGRFIVIDPSNAETTRSNMAGAALQLALMQHVRVSPAAWAAFLQRRFALNERSARSLVTLATGQSPAEGGANLDTLQQEFNLQLTLLQARANASAATDPTQLGQIGLQVGKIKQLVSLMLAASQGASLAFDPTPNQDAATAGRRMASGIERLVADDLIDPATAIREVGGPGLHSVSKEDQALLGPGETGGPVARDVKDILSTAGPGALELMLRSTPWGQGLLLAKGLVRRKRRKRHTPVPPPTDADTSPEEGGPDEGDEAGGPENMLGELEA